MYWVYLIVFTFTVFVPTLVRSGYWIFDTAQMQSISIFFLGSIGFIIFLLMEKSMNRHLFEKSKYQKQVTRMTKDLTQSYSYIGEINRKLDILENIAVGYPESSNLTAKNESEAYDSIMGAVQVFGKSDEFALLFIKKTNFEILKEIKNFPEMQLNFSIKSCDENKCYSETDEFIIVTSPKSIDDIFSCIVIKKSQAAQRIEDQEMMKTLASQALFIYMYMRQKKQIKCVI